jgi:hypothetical protein
MLPCSQSRFDHSGLEGDREDNVDRFDVWALEQGVDLGVNGRRMGQSSSEQCGIFCSAAVDSYDLKDIPQGNHRRDMCLPGKNTAA